jgi:hypothetical protein
VRQGKKHTVWDCPSTRVPFFAEVALPENRQDGLDPRTGRLPKDVITLHPANVLAYRSTNIPVGKQRLSVPDQGSRFDNFGRVKEPKVEAASPVRLCWPACSIAPSYLVPLADLQALYLASSLSFLPLTTGPVLRRVWPRFRNIERFGRDGVGSGCTKPWTAQNRGDDSVASIL